MSLTHPSCSLGPASLSDSALRDSIGSPELQDVDIATSDCHCQWSVNQKLCFREHDWFHSCIVANVFCEGNSQGIQLCHCLVLDNKNIVAVMSNHR